MRLTDEGPAWKSDIAVLVLFFGALIVFGLGRLPLANPDEARYAGIAREMIATGDWVTPRLNETRYFEKPPLVYWLLASARTVLGPSEFVARLIPAICGVAGVVITYLAGRRLFGRETGLAAAIMLGTSVLHFALSRILLLDMVLTLLMSTTLFCFILGVRQTPGRTRRWLFVGLYSSAALATLTKGLIGFLVPGAVMFLWLLVFRQWHRLRPFHLFSGSLLFLAIAAPWHVLMAVRNPEWATFYFVREHWGRFSTSAHQRVEPAWFFIPVVLLGFFPWMGFIPAGIRTAVTGGWARRAEHADGWFLLTWAAFILCFFSLSGSKLIPYVLPVFPPLALITGAAVARAWAAGDTRKLRFGFRVFAFACGVLAVGFFAAVLKPGAIRDVAQAAALRPFGIALGVTLLLGGVVAPWAASVRGVAAGIGTMVATMIGFFLVVVLASPDLQRAGTKELALIARARIADGDRVFHYWAFFHDFVHYAERPVGLVSYVDELEVQFLPPAERASRFIDDAELRRQWAGPERVWLVVRKRDQSHPQSVFSDPAFQHHVVAEGRSHRLISNRP